MTRIAIALVLGVAVTQTATGSISGTITDPSGGLMPGVAVTASLGVDRRSTTSDSRGRFRLDNLAPGLYELEARLAGFETDIDENVNVSAGAAIVWNRKLLVGGTHGSMRPSALVYFVHACGDLCGEHTLLWLRRIPADGPWVVRARRPFWVS